MGVCARWVNNFRKYPLKRDSNLRTGSVKGMIETVNTEVNALENELKEQVLPFLQNLVPHLELQP